MNAFSQVGNIDWRDFYFISGISALTTSVKYLEKRSTT